MEVVISPYHLCYVYSRRSGEVAGKEESKHRSARGIASDEIATQAIVEGADRWLENVNPTRARGQGIY